MGMVICFITFDEYNFTTLLGVLSTSRDVVASMLKVVSSSVDGDYRVKGLNGIGSVALSAR